MTKPFRGRFQDSTASRIDHPTEDDSERDLASNTNAFDAIDNVLKTTRTSKKKRALYLELPEHLLIEVELAIQKKISKNKFFELLIESYLKTKK